MPTDRRGPQTYSKSIEITDADNTNAHLFELAEDRYGQLLWDEGSVPAEDAEPGEELIKTWQCFVGGMGETHDLEEVIGLKRSGYYFSENMQANPYVVRPRQEGTLVTVTNNDSPITYFFEATDANGADKYIYCLTDDCTFKVNANGTLKEIKDHGANAVCGQPAEWNSQWEVPLGDSVDWVGLTTCNDEVNNSGGNDTWTTRTGLKATHFTVVENELVRARSNRTVDKCSATDCTASGNWSGDYNVGAPGTVITSLVNVAGECGIATTDGFYLFDLVSTSRQQLPLLSGLSDADNGKHTTVVGNLVLIPTMDGLWRWVAHTAAQVGPDSIPYYTESKGPSNVPTKLKHYGSAFLGRYIYNAAYGASRYHIFYTILDPNRPTLAGAKWDCLHYTTSEAVTVLFIDSNRTLWMNYGNNLAYLSLSEGGAPEGGNWGNADVTQHFYLPETNLGTPGLKRLRLLEFEIENNAANSNFRGYVYLDGGTVAQVGGELTANGVGEMFWTTGTNDTARRIRPRITWASNANYSPSTTAPGVTRVTLHAEPLEEDADKIVCTVKLDKDTKQKTEIIERQLNRAAVKLKNPITGKKVHVVLYRRRYYYAKQRGDDPAIAACELRFRRSDTS